MASDRFAGWRNCARFYAELWSCSMCPLQRYERMSETAVKSFYSPWQACVIVYVKELNTFLWFFLLLLRRWASVVHVPLLVDGLNSERVCDKRVKHSSLASFSGFTTSTQRLFNPWNFLRGKAFFSKLHQLHFHFQLQRNFHGRFS